LRLFLGLTHDRRNRLKLFAVANVPAQIILESIEPKQIIFVLTHFFSGYSQKLFAADSAQIVAEIIFENQSLLGFRKVGMLQHASCHVS